MHAAKTVAFDFKITADVEKIRTGEIGFGGILKPAASLASHTASGSK
jgi:hypothetical protein